MGRDSRGNHLHGGRDRGGQLYFMGGPKHVGQPTEHLTPDNAQINFAVPSVSVLNECSILNNKDRTIPVVCDTI